MNVQDTDELHDNIERALNAALLAMDYPVLNIIMDTSNETKIAYEKNDVEELLYTINKGFWEIGVYITKKMNSYSSVTPEFFDNIASNISRFFNNNNISYTPENLKRCFKLVNLANRHWFEGIATEYAWQYIADSIDNVNSFDELKNELKTVMFPTSVIDVH